MRWQVIKAIFKIQILIIQRDGSKYDFPMQDITKFENTNYNYIFLY